jgi:hypothetical protein
MSNEALYYPWIDPPSRVMLATAVLYWDRLYTIVPVDIRRPYQNQWTQAAEQLGFLRPRFVDSRCPEVVQASDEFIADIERRAIRQEMQDVRRTDSQSVKRRVRLHLEKMAPSVDARIRGVLQDRRWRSRHPDHEGFYRMQAGYASAYMSRLASLVAESDELAPLTDRRLSRDVLADRFVSVDPYDDVGTNEALLASMSINTVRISPRTSITQLIRFRDNHYDELKRYRKAIRSLAREACGIRQPHLLQRELRRIVREDLKPAQEVIERKLEEADCDFAINVTQVTAVAWTGCALAGFRNLVAASGGAAVGLAFSLVRWRAARERAQKDPLAYLAKLRERFGDD